MIGRLLLAALCLAALVGCPPVRENVENASGGSYGEPAFFVWRPSQYGQAPQWGLLFVPRDEFHDCDGMLQYDWSDADNDYARVQLWAGRDLEWKGEFVNNNDGCGDWYDPEFRCFDGFHYDEGGPYTAYPAGTTLSIDRYDDEEVRGTLIDSTDDSRLGFTAVNCGEMPYYGWVGDAAEPATDAKPAGWRLRFR